MRAVWRWGTQPTHFLMLMLSIVPIAVTVAFMWAYRANIPRGDELSALGDALAAADGTLTWATLTAPQDGHIIFFTRLTTALLTWWTGWNLYVGVALNLVLALIGWALMLALVAQTRPALLAWMMPPSALLVFAVNQDFMWLVSFSNTWFYVHVFMLAALLSVVIGRGGWVALGVGALFATMATFALGNGMLTWVIVALYLLISGEARLVRLGAWGIVGAAVIAVYMANAGISSGGEGSAAVTLNAHTLSVALQFTLGYLGSPFVTDSLRTAQVITGAGVLVGVAALVYVMAARDFGGDKRRFVGVWIALAGFPVGSALLAGLNRPDLYPLGIAASLRMQYKTGAALLWIALLVVIIAATLHQSGGRGWWRRAWALSHIAALVALLFVAVIANYRAVGGEEWHWLQQIKQHRNECYARFLYVQDLEQVNADGDCLVWGGVFVNELAPRRLTMFAEWEPQTVLDGYRSGPVIIDAAGGWEALHVADWMLADVPAAKRYALDVALPDAPPAAWVMPLDVDEADALLESAGAVWAIRRDGVADRLTALQRPDVARASTRITNAAGLPFIVTRYALAPSDDVPSAQVGEHITVPLVARVSGDVAACESVEVATFWRADAPSEVPLSMTLLLVGADGTPIAQTDAALTLTPSNAWAVGQTYLDARALALPCDLAAGEYQLMAGVYDWRDGVRLSATLDDKALTDDLVPMDAVMIP